MIPTRSAGNPEPDHLPKSQFADFGTSQKIVAVEVSAIFPRIGRIASGLVMGHIVAHGLHGIFEGKSLAGDQTPSKGHCRSRPFDGSDVAQAASSSRDSLGRSQRFGHY